MRIIYYVYSINKRYKQFIRHSFSEIKAKRTKSQPTLHQIGVLWDRIITVLPTTGRRKQFDQAPKLSVFVCFFFFFFAHCHLFGLCTKGLRSRLLSSVHKTEADVTHPVESEATQIKHKAETADKASLSCLPLSKLTLQTLLISRGLNYQLPKTSLRSSSRSFSSLNLVAAKRTAARKAGKSVCEWV